MKGWIPIKDWQEHHIASTVLAKDEEGNISFLVACKKGLDSLLHTKVTSRTTALAKIIKKIRGLMYLNIENLELSELTNGIYLDMQVPIYVFIYSYNSNQGLESLLRDNHRYHWVDYQEFLLTLEDWEISGVPFFNKEKTTNLEG